MSNYVSSFAPLSSSSSSSSCSSSKNSQRAEWVLDDASRSRQVVYSFVYEALGDKTICFPNVLNDIVVDYLEEAPGFGEEEWTSLWEKYWLRVMRRKMPSSERGIVMPSPSLPSGFSALWNGPCPIHSGKKVRDTHMLVYIPARVNDLPLTLNNLGAIAKPYFPESHQGYDNVGDSFFEKFGDRPIGKTGWVLMTQDVLPNSKNKHYIVQKEMVSSLAKKALAPYEVPQTLEAAVCILTYYFRSGTRLFGFDPRTYIRCQENMSKGFQIIVGGFSSAGLNIHPRGNDDKDHIGIAALRWL